MSFDPDGEVPAGSRVRYFPPHTQSHYVIESIPRPLIHYNTRLYEVLRWGPAEPAERDVSDEDGGDRDVSDEDGGDRDPVEDENEGSLEATTQGQNSRVQRLRPRRSTQLKQGPEAQNLDKGRRASEGAVQRSAAALSKVVGISEAKQAGSEDDAEDEVLVEDWQEQQGTRAGGDANEMEQFAATAASSPLIVELPISAPASSLVVKLRLPIARVRIIQQIPPVPANTDRASMIAKLRVPIKQVLSIQQAIPNPAKDPFNGFPRLGKSCEACYKNHSRCDWQERRPCGVCEKGGLDAAGCL